MAYKTIQARDLFAVKGNPQLNKDSFTFSEKGQYPYFTRTVLNNGIAGYVEYLDEEHKIKGNSLAVGMLGMQFFYMEKDFYAGQFTKTVFAKPAKLKRFNRKIAQYFITILNKFQKVYQGVLVRDFEEMFYNSDLTLPFKNNELDLDHIEQVIAELQAERLQELQGYLKATGLSNYTLTDEEERAIALFNNYGEGVNNEQAQWKEFIIGELFDIATGRDVIIGRVENGLIPLISHQHEENGITKYINRLSDRRLFNYQTTIPLADRGVFKASTQNQDFHIGTRVKALTFKDGPKTENIRLFVTTSINKLQVLFTEYSENATNKLPVQKIQLPSFNNNPDYKQMEIFIQAVKKLVIADVVKYADKEIFAYQKVIN